MSEMNDNVSPRWREHVEWALARAAQLQPGDRVNVTVLENQAPAWEGAISHVVAVLYPAMVERVGKTTLTVVLDGVVRRNERVDVPVLALHA